MVFSLSCLTGEETGDSIRDNMIRGMRLGFEQPRNFLHPERYINHDLPDSFFAEVPAVVSTAIFEVLTDDIPIDPQMPFIFLRQNRLPEFVVAWFMAFLPKKRIGKMNRFYRALHAIEQYREYVLFPPSAHDAIDTIVAGGGALPDHVRAQLGNEEGEEAKDCLLYTSPSPRD